MYPVAQKATPEALAAAQMQQQVLQEKNRAGFNLGARDVPSVFDGAVRNSEAGEDQFIAYDRGTPKRGQNMRNFAGSQEFIDALNSQTFRLALKDKQNPLYKAMGDTGQQLAAGSDMGLGPAGVI